MPWKQRGARDSSARQAQCSPHQRAIASGACRERREARRGDPRPNRSKRRWEGALFGALAALAACEKRKLCKRKAMPLPGKAATATMYVQYGRTNASAAICTNKYREPEGKVQEPRGQVAATDVKAVSSGPKSSPRASLLIAYCHIVVWFDGPAVQYTTTVSCQSRSMHDPTNDSSCVVLFLPTALASRSCQGTCSVPYSTIPGTLASGGLPSCPLISGVWLQLQ